MISLFDYKTLNVNLNMDTRSISIRLNRPHVEHAINSEMLVEIEDILTWSASHLEVKSIHFTATMSEKNYFSSGLDKDEIKNHNKDQLTELFLKMQKIIYSFFFLPQTIIIDLKNGAQGVASEFSLGADLRVLHSNGKMLFDHLNRGLTPSCGGIGFLSEIVGQTHARNWVLSAESIHAKQLFTTGFIYKIYDQISPVTQLLKNFSKQSPVARIQAKRNFLETIMLKFEKAIETDKACALPGLQISDWKEALLALEENRLPKFLKAREVFKDSTTL